jgi:acetyl esterase/lipase
MPIHLDPEVFRPEAVSAETREFNARLEDMLREQVPNYRREPRDIRADREAGKGLFGPVQRSPFAQERTIAGPGGPLALRVFVPEKSKGVYLHIHGGGWVLGRAHHADIRNEAIMRNCGLAVVSVDYRLAPEDPYPAGADDCEAAALWLIANARAEFGTEGLLIGGESAGGNLAAVTLLRMRDRHSYTGFRAANLVYGAFDLTLPPSQARWGDRELVLSTPTMQWFYDLYVEPGRRRDADVSPLFADLSGMPPALFTVGTMDPLLDDSLFMASRWVASGSPAELCVYPGGVHGFNSFPTDTGKAASARIDAFLEKAAR